MGKSRTSGVVSTFHAERKVSTKMATVASNLDVIAAQNGVDKMNVKYATTLSYITNYCLESTDYRSAVDQNGELIFPMTMENLRGVLGDMCAERENENIRSISTVRGYGTAIKLYTREKATIPEEQITFLNDFQDKYKRVAAQRNV